MASVSSLDADMKRLRMSRYTPGAAREVRTWIEDTLGEQLPNGDLLELLKDGTILCRLANLGLAPPGIKYKKSAMPFVQMENISHFLRACEAPPYNLPAHDRFLTVDLYEQKDPAQVLQCLGAFSRVAHSLFPNKFRTTLGPKLSGTMSPTHTGASNGSASSDFSSSNRTKGMSNTQTAAPVTAQKSGTARPTSAAFTGPSSILYSGYMGGASQGNQGISFGARRQITTPAPYVPSLAEKERKRREKEQEEERLLQLAKEAEEKRKVERAAEEERERIAEQQRWEEETRRKREEEKRRVEQQKREWEEQERKWKQDEEARLREESEAQARAEKETQRRRGLSDARLRGQYLSEYQQEVKTKSRQTSYNDPERFAERERIQELERQLEDAKERERQYEEDRLRRDERKHVKSRSRSRSKPRAPRPPSRHDSNASWTGDEREYLRQQHSQYNPEPVMAPRPLPDPTASMRPLPTPSTPTSRPLPDPTTYSSPIDPRMNRTDRFLAQNPAPVASKPQVHHPAELGFTSESERRTEDARREASQVKTKAGGWASKSLLEREMERERERQREWEASQQEAAKAPRDVTQGANPGQTWDVNQYGYMGGDSQNRGASGIGFGARRQIIGPRPPP